MITAHLVSTDPAAVPLRVVLDRIADGLGAAAGQDSVDRDQALSAARGHREAWLRGYRQQLGFATLVLHDVGHLNGAGADRHS